MHIWLHSLLISALEGGKCSTSRLGLLKLGKASSYTLNMRLLRPQRRPGCLSKEKSPLFLSGFDPQTVQSITAIILLLTRLSLVLLHPTRCKYMYLSPGIMRTGSDSNHFLLLLKTKKDRSYNRWPKWQSLPFTLIRCVCV